MSETAVSPAMAQVADILRGGDEREPETGKPADDESLSGDAIDELAGLLGGDAGEQPSGDDKPAGDDKPDAPVDSLQAAADKLGISIDELYALKVGMPDDEDPVPLSELKDLATAQRRDVLEREAFETTKIEQAAAVATAKEEIGQMLALVPTELRTPEMLQHARGEIQRVRDEQANQLRERIPEWQSTETYTADMAEMRTHVEKFGFETGEFEQVYDARLLAYIRHNALREQRLAGMIEQMRSKRGRDPSKRTPTKRPAAKKQQPVSRSPTDNMLAATADILKGN